jgi:Xaa-Pro aminopeptidase
VTEEIWNREQEAKWPSLSEKERDRRWGGVRELMRAQGLDCLVVFGLQGREEYDRYLTNDQPTGIVIFPLEGELVHLVWSRHQLAAHLEGALKGEASWVHDVRSGANAAGVVEVLREKGYDRANVGVCGVDIYAPGAAEGYVPYRTWANILGNLPHANFHDVSQAFTQLVFVKSDEELQQVRRAAEIAELVCKTMMNATHPGANESEIYAATLSELFRNGASQGPMHMMLQTGPDNPSHGQPIWFHRGQPPRVVKKGDLVQAEIFSYYAGMESQVQMSIAIKPVDPVNRECAALARHLYQIGLKALRVGKTFGEVAEAMEEPLRQAGAWHLTPLIHSLNPLICVGASAVGMEKSLPGIERYKWVRPRPVVAADTVIQANTVWELEPNACLGRHRVNIGGTVIATEEGPVGLNVLPTEMRVTG